MLTNKLKVFLVLLSLLILLAQFFGSEPDISTAIESEWMTEVAKLSDLQRLFFKFYYWVSLLTLIISTIGIVFKERFFRHLYALGIGVMMCGDFWISWYCKTSTSLFFSELYFLVSGMMLVILYRND